VVDRIVGNAGAVPPSMLTKVNVDNPSAPFIVSQLDISAYGGAGKAVRTDSGKVFVGQFPLSAGTGLGAPGGNDDTAPFLIVDAATNTLIGVGSVSTGGDTLRPTDFAFDGLGHVFALAQHTRTGACKVYKYVIADVVAAFPSTYATPVAKLSVAAASGHLEGITFGASYIWGSTASYAIPGVLVRLDPTTGAETTYTDATAGSKYHGCLFAFGSVWASGASGTKSYKVFRFDPASWPSAPTEIVVDPSHTSSNTCSMAADSSTVWVSNGSNFVSSLAKLFRVSTGLGTEAVIAAVSVPAPDAGGATQGVAVADGTAWATLRYGTYPADRGIASFSTGLGSEAFIAYFNPGGTFKDPVDCSIG